jgi:hypothetical protein
VLEVVHYAFDLPLEVPGRSEVSFVGEPIGADDQYPRELNSGSPRRPR